ncbi:hypothetical protein [Kitasatospora sp. MMS16-BH015]|uniref:hypothetical protein n=1 Tax=Kitasatospora sp. MMS16-BH015 TaxID=2018025 RepID=UPI00131A5960|nr:hypothetical protein [Kitasatospora sp. MMS16-BH015]
MTLGSPREDEAARAARLAADQRLVELLRRDGFTGPRFERFAERTVLYGVNVLSKWALSGEIFAKAAAAGRPVRTVRRPAWSRDERRDVAVETALVGFALFRQHGLILGRWHPNGGASLTTYYVGATLRVFPQTYHRWHREWLNGQYLRAALNPGSEEGRDHPDVVDHQAVDPYRHAADRDELGRLLPSVRDPKLRAILHCVADGYTQEETARRVGLPSAKAVERRLARARKTWRTTRTRQV